MKNSLLIVLGLFVGVSALADGGSSTTGGIANPAAEKCAKLGGKSLTVSLEKSGGQIGLCQFGASIIEEWTLFRHLTQTSTQATRLLIHPEPDSYDAEIVNQQAVQFCKSLGAKVILGRKLAINLCEFQDRSIIDSKTLFLGTSKQNKKLIRILSKK